MSTRTIGIHTVVLAALLPALAGAQSAAVQATPPVPPAPPAPPAAPALPGEQEKVTGPVQTERIVRTFKAGPGAGLVLSNIAGDIKIAGSSGSEIRVEAVKNARARDEASAKALLEATRVEIVESAGRVEVRTVPKDKSQWERHSKTWVDYTVSLPSTASADVRAVSGDINISGVTGQVDLSTVSGDIAAANLGARVSLKSVSGDVLLSTTQADGELQAKSVSGDVMIKEFKARSVEAGSVSGDVRLLGGVCERASAESVSGDLELSAGIVKGGRYELKSHSGSVMLALDGKVGFELEASSFSGRIRSDLPLNVASQSDDRMNRSLRGTFGDGAAWVRLTSFSGNVVVSKK